MIRAAFEGLKKCQSPRMVASRRGRKVSDLVGRRDGGAAAEVAKEQDNG